MRHRRWVLLLASILIAIVPLGLLGLRAASRHPAFRRAIAERLMPNARGRLSIGELEIGLASIRASDVRIDLANGGFVEIPQATVGVSYRKLLGSGFRLSRSLGTAVVTGPRVVIVRDTQGGGAPSRGPFDPAPILESLPDRMSVSDASLTFVDRAAGSSFLAASIDVVTERRRDGRIEADASGDCLGGEENLTGGFVWDRPSRTLSVTAEISGGDVSKGLPLVSFVPVRALSGGVDAKVVATMKSGREAVWSVAFDLEGASIEIPELGETVESLSAGGSFDGDVLRIDDASGTWRSSAFSADGSASLAGRSFGEVRLSASSLPLAALADAALPGAGLVGEADVALSLTGPFSGPTAEVSFTDAAFEVASVAFSDCAGSGRFAPGRIDVDRFEGSVVGGRLALSGFAARSDTSAAWTLDASGEASALDLAALRAGDARPDVTGRLSLGAFRVRGTPAAPHVEAAVSWDDLTIGGARLSSATGDVVLDGEELTGELLSDDGTYTVEGSASNVLSRPAIDVEVVLSGFAADSTFGLSGVPLVPHAIDGRVSLLGVFDALTLDGAVTVRGDDLEGDFSVMGGLTGGPGGRRLTASCRSEDASVRGVSVPVSADVVLDREALDVTSIELGGVATARARVGLRGDRSIEGGIVVSGASLSELIRAATGSSSFSAVRGLVSASATLRGTLGTPEVELTASADSVRLRGVTGLEAEVVASLRGRLIALDSATLSLKGQEFLSASGSIDLDGDMTVTAGGLGVPGELLGGSEDTRFDVTMGVGGSRDRPTFDAKVESSGGAFLGIPFDRFMARVTGAEGAARVEPLALERTGSYRLTASGRIPYPAVLKGGSAEGALTIEVDGDPLALLAEATPLAESAAGEGTMSAYLVGNRDGVAVARGELRASARTVTPSALFGELTDVSASVTVVDGAVASGSIEGLVDGTLVRLESRRDASVDGRALESLSMFGLDVGVLALSTDPEGVRVSVPGLMQAGHVGNVAARGKEGAAAFLIGGPPDHPLLWGELELSDMTFTYPFLEGRIGLGTRFLSDAEWSVRMTAGRNLWYWRADATLNVEWGGTLDLIGIPSDHTMCVAGRLASRRGTVDYANAEFDVETASVEFPAFCEPPRFYIEAAARVEDGTRITLTMDSIEGDLTLAAPGATLDESALVLRSDAPEDDTREKILSKLEYGMSYDLLQGEEQASLERKQAIDVVGGQIGGRFVRPLLSPIEARIRRDLRLDLVRIDIDFVGHFLSQLDEWRAREGRAEYVPFLADTRITLGKYVSRNWLLSYVGRAEVFEQDIGYQRLGLRHEIGIEYEVSPHTSLSLRAVYDPTVSAWDRWISIENRFEF
jgi:hypothetical protein